MDVQDAKQQRDARRRIMSALYMTACYSFSAGLSVLGAFRHRGDFYYYFMTAAFLIMSVTEMLRARRELTRFFPTPLPNQSAGQVTQSS